MKVKIDSDEWYPVYSIGEWGKAVKITKEALSDYERVIVEFYAWQDRLKRAYTTGQVEFDNSKETM